MNKLTLRQAVTSCRDMWLWMANNPGRKKREWLSLIGFEEYIDNDCFACQYAVQQKPEGDVRTICRYCFLKDLWPSDVEPSVGSCMKSNSAYQRAIHARDPRSWERKQAALEIVAACDKILKQMDVSDATPASRYSLRNIAQYEIVDNTTNKTVCTLSDENVAKRIVNDLNIFAVDK